MFKSHDLISSVYLASVTLGAALVCYLTWSENVKSIKVKGARANLYGRYMRQAGGNTTCFLSKHKAVLHCVCLSDFNGCQVF